MNVMRVRKNKPVDKKQENRMESIFRDKTENRTVRMARPIARDRQSVRGKCDQSS